MNKTMLCCVAALTCCLGVLGGEPKGAGGDVPLWPEGKMPSVQTNQTYAPYLRWFAPEKRTTDAILIAVSGGGYGGCGVEGFEVSPMRDYFLEKGMTVVTMRYRCPRPVGLAKHVTAWQDAQRTVRLVRSEAAKRGLNPDNIGFTGCSAGGHLAMMVAVSSQTPAYPAVDEIDRLPCNVNWAIPVYPAYLIADGAERHNVKKGNDLSDPLVPELAFDAATPPMCFFHGDEDGWSAMGSVRAYHKLRTMGIPAELHVMALEQHCFQSNPRPGTPAARWKDRAWEWLVSMDVVTGHPQVWRGEWTCVFPAWGPKLEQQADFAPGSWNLSDWGNVVLTARQASPLWFKGAYGDCALDLEFWPGAATAVLFRPSAADEASAVRLDLSGFKTCKGRWNRLTVRCGRGTLLPVVNGCPQATLRTPALQGAEIRLGVTGRGNSFRNVRTRRFRDVRKAVAKTGIANERIGVCSWSWRMPLKEVAVHMDKAGVKGIHLALGPFIAPDERHGAAEGVEVLQFVKDKVAKGEWKLMSTMIGMVGEDYSTLETIKATGGIVPDRHWEANRRIVTRGARLTQELGCALMSTHAGFLDETNPKAFRKYVERVAWMRDECRKYGVTLILESGQETAEDLAAFMPKVPGVGINFDPANMILYAKGRPSDAVKVLFPWIRQIHVKDACRTKVPGTWGAEVVWGEGEVGGQAFVAELEAMGYKGDYVIEFEADGKRPDPIVTAIRSLAE